MKYQIKFSQLTPELQEEIITAQIIRTYNKGEFYEGHNTPRTDEKTLLNLLKQHPDDSPPDMQQTARENERDNLSENFKIILNFEE